MRQQSQKSVSAFGSCRLGHFHIAQHDGFEPIFPLPLGDRVHNRLAEWGGYPLLVPCEPSNGAGPYAALIDLDTQLQWIGCGASFKAGLQVDLGQSIPG